MSQYHYLALLALARYNVVRVSFAQMKVLSAASHPFRQFCNWKRALTKISLLALV